MNIGTIKSDVNFLARCTSATFPDADKVRSINIAYQDIARLIWESADGWQYNDGTAGGNPVVKTSLTHNTQDYTIPSTAQRIHEIAIEDNSGNWHKLRPIDWADITSAPQEFLKTPGLPIYYNLAGRTVSFYPIPASGSVTLSSGIAFFIDRDVTEFNVTATTTVPGFATPFHRLLSYAAALDFSQDAPDRELLVAQISRMKNSLTRFYSKRAVEMKTQIKPAGKRRWRQYL